MYCEKKQSYNMIITDLFLRWIILFYRLLFLINSVTSRKLSILQFSLLNTFYIISRKISLPPKLIKKNQQEKSLCPRNSGQLSISLYRLICCRLIGGGSYSIYFRLFEERHVWWDKMGLLTYKMRITKSSSRRITRQRSSLYYLN